jgi:hypothetical protein
MTMIINKIFHSLNRENLRKVIGNERGSALILVIIASIILTLIGLAGLTQVGSDLATTRNFYDDKEVFYSADAGIHIGTLGLKNALDPSTVTVNQNFTIESSDNRKSVTYVLRSGRAEDAAVIVPVQYFKGYIPPPPPGISIELSGEISVKTLPWMLNVTAERGNTNSRRFSQKELETVIITLSSEY